MTASHRRRPRGRALTSVLGAFGVVVALSGPSLLAVPAHAAPTPSVADDFDGDGHAEAALFHLGVKEWTIADVGSFRFGRQTALEWPVPGDYLGTGTTVAAIYRSGVWYVRGGEQAVSYGRAEDRPVPADWTGDGRTDMAVYRASTQQWWIRGVGVFRFGRTGDVPVVGDFNGDGTAEAAVYRPSAAAYYVRGSSRVVEYDIPAGSGADPARWIPLAADRDGDGKDDRILFDRYRADWYVGAEAAVHYGTLGDWPVPGDYAGSDGRAEFGVVRYQRGGTPGGYYVEGRGSAVLPVRFDDVPARPGQLLAWSYFEGD